MKRLMIFLLAVGCCLIRAQTNGPATSVDTSKQTEVDSKSAVFDMGGEHSARQVTYYGDVRVTDPKIKLWCEQLTLDLPPGSSHVSHILAETNVVIDFIGENGEKYHVTSDKAVYHYAVVNLVTNETVTWTGNPIVTTKDGKIWSEPLVWDRKANKFFFTKPKVILPEGLSGSGTNSALKLY